MATEFPQRTLTFDPAVYRLAAIKKAAYKFGDRCNVEITTQLSSGTAVRLTPRTCDLNLDLIASDFHNEVLDQDLREAIAEETASIRSLLLAQAFSATSLVDPIGETADYQADPLRICQPDGAGQISQSIDDAGESGNAFNH